MLGMTSVDGTWVLAYRVAEDMPLREEAESPHTGLQAAYVAYSSQHDDRFCYGQ